MVEYSPVQLDRIEQKLDRLLKRFVDVEKLPTEITQLRVGQHDLMPSDEELRKRLMADNKR